MNLRAKLTLQDIRSRQLLGLQRRPSKRLPRQQYPRAIEREYARTLVRVARRTSEQLEPLLAALPGLISSAQADRERFDVGEARRVSELIESASSSLKLNTSAIEGVAAQFAERTSTHQRIQMGAQVRAAFGVDVFTPESGLRAASEAFTAENVALIKDLPRKTLAEIEGIAHRGISQGLLHKDIAKQIQARLKIGERRAKLIARDQVGKFYGAVQKHRQQGMGVTHFIWRTAGDERVRDEHVSLNGRRFSWAEGAGSEGIPGEPVNCRCYGSPDFSELLK